MLSTALQFPLVSPFRLFLVFVLRDENEQHKLSLPVNCIMRPCIRNRNIKNEKTLKVIHCCMIYMMLVFECVK